jgi:hypothetical protein
LWQLLGSWSVHLIITSVYLTRDRINVVNC